MIPIQLIAVIVALAAIHLTYLYYKRANFTRNELYFWLFIWLIFILTAIFPKRIEPLVGYLRLNRLMDLLMIGAFIILFAIVFYSYVAVRRVDKRLEKLVREMALRDLEKK